MPGRDETVLVVIDAQRAFVDPAGSVARTFGAADIQPGTEALDRLCRVLADRDPTIPSIFVRSEFRPGQFTDNDLDHGMAYVCVPGHGIDCEWAAGIEMARHDVVVTKHQVDATESAAFQNAVEHALADDVTRIAIVGFQFTTCVVATAVSTLGLVRGRGVRVAVIEPLTGSRVSSHLPGPSGLSRVEATRRHLEAAGVELVRHPCTAHQSPEPVAHGHATAGATATPGTPQVFQQTSTESRRIYCNRLIAAVMRRALTKSIPNAPTSGTTR